MATIATLALNITGNVSGLQSALSSAGKSIDDFGKGMQNVGKSLTVGVTAPLVALGGAGVVAATQLNASMANVASLGIATERVEELKGAVQTMAVEVGKSTEDLSGGVYQVISAFGDTADTVEIVRINAIAAAAGLSTTEEAINLTSAVTKAYGDTSATAVQKVSDLAFVTVQLGQTTFPELASAMGSVTPIAEALGIKQEELFASMATLTGVTGSTAEVSTQLRATYQAILKPTGDMATALSVVAARLDDQEKLVAGPLVESWNKAQTTLIEAQGELSQIEQAMQAVDTSTKEGEKTLKLLGQQYKVQKSAVNDYQGAVDNAAAALGRAIIESVGQEEALRMLADTTGGNTNELAKMFGSVEALNAVLALTGAQAETFSQKQAAMNDVAGASQGAFEAQTQGINKLGFMYQQARVRLEVLLQKMGDALGPVLLAAAEALEPLAEKALELANGFSELSPSTQRWILAIAGVAAAAGPLLVALGAVVSAVTTLGPAIGAVAAAFGLLLSPIGLVVGALAALFAFDVGGIRTATVEAISGISTAFGTLYEVIAGGDIGEAMTSIKDSVTALFAGEIDAGQFLTQIKDAVAAIDFAEVQQQIVAALGLDNISFEGVIAGVQQFATDLQEKLTEVAGSIDWSMITGAFDTLKTTVSDALAAIDWTPAAELFDKLKTSVMDKIAGIDWAGGIAEAGETANNMRDNVLSWLTDKITGIDWSGASLDLAGFINGVTEKIESIDWSQIDVAAIGGALIAVLAPGITAAIAAFQWVIASENWAGLGTAITSSLAAIEWGELGTALLGLVTAIGGAIGGLDWSGVTGLFERLKTAILNAIKSAIPVLDFGGEGLGIEWPGWDSFISFPTGIAWPGWDSFISFPKGINWPGWATWIKFPNISWPGWKDFIKFPSIPEFPGWNSLWSWMTGSGEPGANQLGTRFWQGGPTWVGEGGRELLWLPRGAQIMPNRESEALAGAGAGGYGGPIAENVYVRSEEDLHKLAYLVIDYQRRRRRG